MKGFLPVLALTLAGLQLPSAAADLPDCRLEQGALPVIKGLADNTARSQARYFLEVAGALKNGTENSYDRDEAVLNVDLRVLRSTVALTPTSDVKLKNSWALSPNFSFRKGRQLRVWRELEVADGRKFLALELEDATLFVDESNVFCNKAYGKGVWQAGTLSIEPDGVTVERGSVEDLVKSGTLRVIYLGTTAGAMKFQEVWVQGSQIGKSVTRTFDQFARTIEVAGFKFDVLEAKGDKLRLRYEIASRSEINQSQISQIALQTGRN